MFGNDKISNLTKKNGTQKTDSAQDVAVLSPPTFQLGSTAITLEGNETKTVPVSFLPFEVMSYFLISDKKIIATSNFTLLLRNSSEHTNVHFTSLTKKEKLASFCIKFKDADWPHHRSKAFNGTAK